MATQPGKRPTIADVAARAGVSKGAVSRSFNGGGRISPQTIERIRTAAVELGWVPHAAARAINGSPAEAIGLVVRRSPDLLERDPFYPTLLAGIEGVLAEHGYAAIVRFVSSPDEERASYRRLIAERRVDGFVINDLRRRETRLRLLTEIGAPAVIVGRPGRRAAFPSIDSDSDDAVRELITTLIEAGHTTIAHVSGPPEFLHAQHRQQLWADTLQQHGLDAARHLSGNFTADGGAEATRELLDSASPPTAIFYANDVMAVAGMSVATSRGLAIPDDLAIAGFDDIILAAYCSPGLTTIRCDYREVGRRSVTLLLDQIDGRESPSRTLVPSQVVIRGSTGPRSRSRANNAVQRRARRGRRTAGPKS